MPSWTTCWARCAGCNVQTHRHSPHPFLTTLRVSSQLNSALRSEEEAHAAGAELRAELKAVQEDQATKTAALQAAQEDLSAKKAALQAAQAALQAALVSEEEAHAASAELRAELAAAREELSAKCASLQAALSELTSNNATMQAALDAAVATSQAQAAALQAAEDVAASERLAASARFADAEAQCAALKEQLRRAQRAVSAAEARAREACSRCDQLAMELEVLRGSAVSAASGDVVMLDAELERAHAAHAVQLEQAQRERAEAEARLQEMQRVMETQAAEEERWRTEFEQAAQEDMENALADLRQQYEQLLESAASSWQRGEGEPTASQSPRRVSRLAQVLATTPVKGATAAAFLASPLPQKQQRRVHTEPIVIHDIPDAPPMPLRLRAVGAALQAEVIAAGPGAWLIMCSFVASLGQQSPAVLMAAVLLAAGGIIARTVQHR